MITLSIQDARRLAISKQHLDGQKRPSMLDVIRDLGCLQLDPISHIAPTHQLVLWSRLGNYDLAELDALRWEHKALFEYWAHAASLVLTEEFPLYQWQMQRVKSRSKFEESMNENPEIRELYHRILARLKQEKAVFSRDIEDKNHHLRIDSRWYSGRYISLMLSGMWDRGEVTVVGRQGKQRQWGLMDDFLPEWTPRHVWTDEEVTMYAIQRSLQALGVATVKQMKIHYTRNRYPKLTAVLKKLLAEGTLLPVILENNGETIKGEWFIHKEDLALLKRIQTGNWKPKTTLLSPFDNLICDRDRTELLWQFYYRIEIYVPKAKREYGYYVLPILHGDQLIGRVDAKMNRKRSTFELHNIYAEPDAPDGIEVETAVFRAINNLAVFLGATQLEWGNVAAKWSSMASHAR